MSKPIHTPGPVIARPYPESKVGRITITGATSPVAIAEIVPTTMRGYDAIAEADGRLIKAAYNAFDSAAKKLGCNAVELAERMADGAIAELVEAVQAAKEMADWFMEHSRQADHAHSELKQPLHETAGWKEMVDAGYNGLMASYHGQFEEAIAKVRGGAL